MGKEKENRNGKTKGNAIALLPIGVFLVLYLGLGILFEYVMKIPMGFYNVPIVVAFLAAILVACLQNRAVNFEQKLEIMSGGVGDKMRFFSEDFMQTSLKRYLESSLS